jgi:hypothetical protein
MNNIQNLSPNVDITPRPVSHHSLAKLRVTCEAERMQTSDQAL